ncbi:MAG: hypothetical protein AAGF84_09415 [Planctomycetota bacterium]
MTNFQIIDPDERPREVATATPPQPLPLPGPAVDFDVRLANEADIPWIDALQRESNREARALGFWSLKMFEGYIAKGNIWIAERSSGQYSVASGQSGQPQTARDAMSSTGHLPLGTEHCDPERRLGYLIASDTYFKREDVGVIYQMNIAPGSRRSFVASNLLQRVWETWPWGVKLCGLWCAQDLQANYFWEKCGFRPIAFRAGSSRQKVTNLDGSTSEGRVHLYWQKRIRAGDGGPDDPSSGAGGTPYWYPSKTGGGAMREDRVVFPMPPASEVHWSKAAPRFLPGVGEVFEAIREDRAAAERETLKLLASPDAATPDDRKAKRQAKREAVAEAWRKRDAAADAAARRSATMAEGGLSFGAPPPTPAQVDADLHAERQAERSAKAEATKQTNQKAKSAGDAAAKKNHPVLEQMARTLRDRWVETVATDEAILSLSVPEAANTYDVSRQVTGESTRGTVKRVENSKRLAA